MSLYGVNGWASFKSFQGQQLYIVSYQYIIHIHYYSQCESPLGKRTTIPILWKVSKTTNYKYGY